MTEPTNDRPRVSPGYFRLRDAAEYCRVTPQYLNKAERMGTGPARIKKGRMTFYAKTDLDAWMARDRHDAA